MPDFGETTIGASEQYINTNYQYGTKFTLATGMTINSITFRVKSFGSTFNARGAIYSDVTGTPTALLTSSTANTSITAGNTWFTCNVTPYVAAAGTYWIVMSSNVAPGTTSLAMRTPGDVTNQTIVNDIAPTFPTYDNPMVGGGFNDMVFSIYATGTTAAGGDLTVQLEEPTLGVSTF